LKSSSLKNDDDDAVANFDSQILEYRTSKMIRLGQYKEFSQILKIKFDNDEKEINKNETNEFDRIIFLGLKAYSEEETGYEIIHKGKAADMRVLKNLGRIAKEFNKIHTYPLIDSIVLQKILKKALGTMDPRTLQNYRKTVLDYCNVDENIIDRCKDSRLGKLNVSRFVKRIPYSFWVGG